MSTKLTRREIAAAFAGSAALFAQTPSTPPPLPANPDEELKAAKEFIQRNAEQLAKVPLEMSTEPAVHFKA